MNPATVGLSALGIYVLTLVGMRLVRTPSASLRHIDAVGRPMSSPSLVGALRARIGRAFGPAVLRTFSTARRQRIEHRLDAAGRPDRVTIHAFAATKAADTATCLVLGVAATVYTIWLLPVLMVYGWFRADLRYRGLATKRQARIERDLPDFLDILGVTVQAGLKFRSAIRRVGEQFESPVSEEFRTALQQMDVGASRRSAFEAIRDRNDSVSLNRFVGSLLQAEELGAPLSDAMEAISRDMRKAFGQRVRKAAAEAAPKVSLAATLLMMPGAALLLIGGLILGSDLDFGSLTG